ncbi:hypothetical protein AAAZ63_05960 [Bacteroides xylanisolvens]|uniref:hypothetical protein n=1 Tax=Bacteroides xylanisolvens TaxID=371601 RepID=UPI0032C12A99
MKKCKNYNMKTEFEKLRDFDFTVNRVCPRVINGTRQTVFVPAGTFSLFGVSVIEARAICKKISSTTNYICTANLITE